MADLATGYILKGECPNWNEALTIAQRKLGCSVGSRPPSKECQEQLPCDVCQFLKEGAWPPARIVDFPGKDYFGNDPNILGSVIGDSQWKDLCPIDDATRAEFKASLCFEKKVWGFDRVDTLAKAMVHEALHLCKYVGGTGPATIDKKFWDYLYCATVQGVYAPDAADLVEICWESGP